MAHDGLQSRSTSRVSAASRSSSNHSQWQETTELHTQASISSVRIHQRGNSSSDSNEGFPLLSPSLPSSEHSSGRSGSSLGSLDWNNEVEEESSKSFFYLFILTLSIGGLQIAWSVELSNGSPYLQSLGMSKSLLAFVWIAGPLSGVLMQPYIGIRSDNSRISWGRRLPFMMGGAVATAISFMALAWTREIVHGFLGLFGADPESHGVRVCSIIFAILFVYVLDFAINAVQAAIRAFIVDNAPTHQQEDANSWAGRITGVGNILGYLAGYVNLPEIFPWLGHTQFQVLSAMASFAIISTVVISALYIRERDPRLEGPPAKNPGVLTFFRQVFESTLRLPPQIRKICEAQFFNWLGWFGFLFYMTTYIGQLKLNPYFAAHPDLTPDEVENAWEDATRIGTFALLIFAITSFAANMLLPFFVTPSYSSSAPTKPPTSPHLASHSTPGALSASIHSFVSTKSSTASRSYAHLKHLISLLQIPWLTLRRTWLLSHIFFALCMASTFFITTATAATVLTAFIGIPWAVSLWAPFALISAEISKRDTEARRTAQRRPNGDGGAAVERDQAGVILGLHNVAVSAPQIVATLIGSLIFKLTQKPRGAPYDDSVGWVLRFGALAALVAAFFTWRIGEEGQASDRSERKTYQPVGESGREDGEV